MLSPTKPRPEASAAPALQVQGAQLSTRLQALLKKHGLAAFAGQMRAFSLTEQELMKWDLVSLMQLLRSPATETRQFLAELHSQARRALWVQGSA